MLKFPKKVSKTDAFAYFILILKWEGISARIAQIFPRARLRGNTFRGPGEIVLGARIWGLAEKLPSGRHVSSLSS